MDKNSEHYRKLCENPKFVRREARAWYRKLHEHNMRAISSLEPPLYSEFIKRLNNQSVKG